MLKTKMALAATLVLSNAPKPCEWAVCWTKDGKPDCRVGKGTMTLDDRIEFLKKHCDKEVFLKCESAMEEKP